MSQIIDRRVNGKNKSAVNRQKFIGRYKKHLKKAVEDAVSKRSITDMERGENVNIPSRDISEPTFGIGRGGKRDTVFPGNKEFVTGDEIPRPKGGAGQGGGKDASSSGEGEDDFTFTLSREEFMDLFFEDLELPNMIKTQLAKDIQFKKVRAGYTTTGNPSNINVVRSMKGALARRIALAGPYNSQIREINEQIADEKASPTPDEKRITILEEEILSLKGKVKRIPYIDTFDLRYNNRIDEPVPTTQAVMFCLMDVSGSMGEFEKDVAKRFFTLLYLFLTRSYEYIELVFIRHHTIAKEVDEEEFFYSRETGGTVVSSALKLMREIIQDRYPTTEWNIYAAQASDGDNWTDDSPTCRNLLIESIMPYLQYYAYIEINADTPIGNLWREYEKVSETCPNFAMQKLVEVGEIYPVFRKLFEKQQ
ncbi:hypothetical protein Tel_08820 [Candidatus Tenderia electrophaga]|uniref:UPF0229 protein Tel_08820 n=1 Tax=Candidatus Tenderia electrophaga TaxID=1748243 RepID=A0A0S2TDL8_9GAMM|nr:hypothetical protein Tel_08820 [Candidatus Tenderia electrophaga]